MLNSFYWIFNDAEWQLISSLSLSERVPSFESRCHQVCYDLQKSSKHFPFHYIVCFPLHKCAFTGCDWSGFCLVHQLPKEQLLEAVPLMVAHLQAESIVQHTYAAHSLERLFTMRGANNATLWVFPVQDMRMVMFWILTILFIFWPDLIFQHYSCWNGTVHRTVTQQSVQSFSNPWLIWERVHNER